MKTMKTTKGTELPIISLKGKDYLQVAHRLVWFREEKPNWFISTSFEQIHEQFAIAKCTIFDDQGKPISMGHKREDAKHFPDYMEKAETGAIGRALAHLGYGTQFAPDLDEGMERLVDSPVQRVKPQLVQAQVNTITPQENNHNTIENVIMQGMKAAKGNEVISDSQRRRLFAIANTSKWSEEQVKELIKTMGFESTKDITKARYEEICKAIEGV